MASATALAEYAQERIEVNKDLIEDGFPASFGIRTGQARRNNGTYQEEFTEMYFPLDSVEEWKGTALESSQRVWFVGNKNNLLKVDLFAKDLNHVVKDIKAFPDTEEMTGIPPIFFEVLING